MVLYLFKNGLFFLLFVYYGFEAGVSAEVINDATILTGCSSHCTLNFDKNLECWNKTLKFYEQTLVGGLRHYSNVLVSFSFV